MLYALLDITGALARFETFDTPPAPLPAAKGLRWLPVEDQRPAPAEGETLDGPAVIVEADKVRRVWTIRAKTYAEKLAEIHAARAAAYPPLGDQLDAAFKARMGDGSELAAIDAAIQAVKTAHPKPAA
ncbi:MAG TPA: hypothetical protein PKZ97_16270 [Azospirillaceae bacterium]|nr:hypothetical protein [Azospirillaceae bacterium]